MTDTSKLIERARKRAAGSGPYINDYAPLLAELANALTDLEARLRIETKRADDAEARNDFLMTELDKLIEKAKQT